MKIDGLNISMSPIEPIIKKPEVEGAGGVSKVGGKQSFAEAFKDAIKEVDDLQKDADKQIESMVTGENPNPHTAMIALEKADMAFQMMNAIRAKIVRAYEEVIRTQV